MTEKLNQYGFTLVELLIATTIFSVILLLCTFGMVQIGRTYYKGVTTARTQNVARDVMDNIAQAIEFGSSKPLPDSATIVSTGSTSGAFCAGNLHFIYSKNTPVKGAVHAFQVDNNTLSCTSTTPTNSKELLGENMRLSKFSITKSAVGDYTIIVKVTYGDNDLINAEGSCNGGVGNQFCASSELQTTVHRRLTN